MATIAKETSALASAALRIQRLEELYKSACAISEQRRQDLAAAIEQRDMFKEQFQRMLQERHLFRESLEYAVVSAFSEAECEKIPGEPIENQPAGYLEATERAQRFSNLKKLLGDP